MDTMVETTAITTAIVDITTTATIMATGITDTATTTTVGTTTVNVVVSTTAITTVATTLDGGLADKKKPCQFECPCNRPVIVPTGRLFYCAGDNFLEYCVCQQLHLTDSLFG